MAPATVGGVLCTGNIVLDILVRPVTQPKWGATCWVDSIEQHLGGNGANTSFALGRLGVPVRLAGYIGNDAFADYAAARLASAGVDIARLVRSASPTAVSVALVNPEGERALLHRPGASLDAFSQPVEFTLELITGCTHYHLANPYALPNMRRHAAECLRRAIAAGLTTSVDTGWDARGEWMGVLAACLPCTGLLFVNEDEARMLTGAPDYPAAARQLLEPGPSIVVVKRAARGCAVFRGSLPGPAISGWLGCSSHISEEESQFEVPAFDVPVMDTTGAGDCFVAGFLAALLRGTGLRAAARFANAVAALSVTGLGAAQGLRGYSETLDWMAAAGLRA